jgi:hypothetical protein|tara:strand:+ start:146 stop:331 length:186 start_codon:yes stop_codon:yes gene_type:complete
VTTHPVSIASKQMQQDVSKGDRSVLDAKVANCSWDKPFFGVGALDKISVNHARISVRGCRG